MCIGRPPFENKVYQLSAMRPISVLRFWTSEGLTQAESSSQGVELPRPAGDLLEGSSQRILAGTILVGRLGDSPRTGRPAPRLRLFARFEGR